MDDYTRFILSVRGGMLKRKTSARALARYVGISPSYLTLILAGKRPPPADEVIEKLALSLGLNVDRLLMDARRLPTYLRWTRPLTDKGHELLRAAYERIFEQHAETSGAKAQPLGRSRRP